jgi:hypothetical protein
MAGANFSDGSMDYETFVAMGGKVEWIPDRLRLAEIKPRHIGRPISFDAINPATDSTYYVIGTLEGAAGQDLIVSGDTYDYDSIQNIRIWRRAVKND